MNDSITTRLCVYVCVCVCLCLCVVVETAMLPDCQYEVYKSISHVLLLLHIIMRSIVKR